jgi:atypical dual specificity phosphatase
LQHFDQARQFIDRAKYTRGRCLVHCAMGINRSGAICTAYILLDQQLKLLDVVRLMKQRRGTVLWNRGFQRMLVRFARQRGLL